MRCPSSGEILGAPCANHLTGLIAQAVHTALRYLTHLRVVDEDALRADVVGVDALDGEVVGEALLGAGLIDTLDGDDVAVVSEDLVARVISRASWNSPSVTFQNGWSSVVVIRSPATTRSISVSSCTQTWVTCLATCSPLSGSVASTLSPTLTSSIGFSVPSAINTTVEPEKLEQPPLNREIAFRADVANLPVALPATVFSGAASRLATGASIRPAPSVATLIAAPPAIDLA